MKELGFVGFGEAATNFASGIASQKSDLQIIVYDKNGVEETVKHLNLNLIITKSPDELLSKANIVIIAVPGSFDFDLFKGINPVLFNGKLIIDICTAKPAVKLKISKMVDKAGGSYVDVAAMGSFPSLKHKVPMLISGKGIDKMITSFKEFDLNIKPVGEKAGDAMIIKLCRSIYMKGLAALSIEMDRVSEQYGVKDYVYSSLADSMDNDRFNDYTPRLIKGTFKNLERRTAEVKECMELIEAIGEKGIMTEATYRQYKDIIERNK